MLRAIDISSWQEGIVPSQVDCDVVIVKATGGAGYENPHWRAWADDVLASGKLLGLYHFAMERGCAGSPVDEARHFLDATRDYWGRFVPVLDWEADALWSPASWAREWLDTVAAETGATPMMYAYASNVAHADYSELTRYPLWMASYLYRYDGAGWVDDPANTWGTGSWDKMFGYQYTSTGRVAGYGGNLDLSVFYTDRDGWLSMQGGAKVKVNEVAAAIHRHMCECPKHGYTQGGARWGQGPNGPCYVEVGGRTYEIPGNDFDCSSSVKKAWEIALQGSPYEGVLGYNGFDMDGNWQSWYTGNEIGLFVGSGLFSWEPMSFIADTGDLYLNVEHHVAMCQTQVPDVLSEFLSNEWGGIEGGQIGDQTGGESVVRAFWWPSFGWDGILHYNGKADYEGDDDMQPHEVWEYNWEGTAVNGNMYNALNGIAVDVCNPHDSAAGDGTYGSMKDRIDYIDMRVKDTSDKVGEISDAIKALADKVSKMSRTPLFTIGGRVDYDKLADAVARKLGEKSAR